MKTPFSNIPSIGPLYADDLQVSNKYNMHHTVWWSKTTSTERTSTWCHFGILDFYIKQLDSIPMKTPQQLLENFNVIASDLTRPWGGFYVIDETQAQAFADTFFDGLDVNTLTIGGKLSPKLLVVAAGQRLSWQYHNRRAEIWKVVQGTVGVVRSDDDAQGELVSYTEGQTIKLAQGERHRLVGLDAEAIIAEIWQHTDAGNPSNEDDIVRVQDDFGR